MKILTTEECDFLEIYENYKRFDCDYFFTNSNSYVLYKLFAFWYKEERKEGRKLLLFILASPFIHWYKFTYEGELYGL